MSLAIELAQRLVVETEPRRDARPKILHAMSAQSASSSQSARPSGDFNSMQTLRLLRLMARK